MDTLLRFGTGSTIYEFTPDNQVSLSDNFGNAVPQTTRLPGVSGGLDEYGRGIAPTEIGNVSVTFWLFFSSTADKTAKLDALKTMQSWGVQRLFKQSSDNNADERYCDARINNIRTPENAKDLPHERIRVSINFQVSNPFWFDLGTDEPKWGAVNWGSFVWGGTTTSYPCSGTQTDFTLDVVGNVETQPRFTVTCGTGQSASDIRIQLLDGVTVLEEIRYDSSLTAGDTLDVNCAAYSVLLNGSDGYINEFTFDTVAWFRLYPGANAIRVLMDNAGDACTVTPRYQNSYR